ncbi:MAG: hypothetical protein HWD62_16605 [Cyclobacteriaceae bacterium]|nr:MAG: hypothetical protein HWD62_16605 [Cyclobacteriaceae bacterium]
MNNKEGHASMVLEQPNVKDVERNATQEEINTWFEENGFTQSGEKTGVTENQYGQTVNTKLPMPVQPMF